LHDQLASCSPAATPLELEILVQRFRLAPEAVAPALQEADSYRQQRGADTVLEASDLSRAFGLRAQRAFGPLAQRITPSQDWDDLMVGDDVQRQLREVGTAIRHRGAVLGRLCTQARHCHGHQCALLRRLGHRQDAGCRSVGKHARDILSGPRLAYSARNVTCLAPSRHCAGASPVTVLSSLRHLTTLLQADLPA
jgi:hypothetical protein